MVRSIFVIIGCVLFISLIGIFCIVKFVNEIEGNEFKRNPNDVLLEEKSMLSYSKNMGVITLKENYSYVASERFPYMAAITAKSSSRALSFSCFGCVILMKWVVTTAHCKKSDHTHRVLLYFDYVRNHTQTYPIVLWRVHEDYDPNGTFAANDIALAKININVVPIISHAAIFTNRMVRQVQASVWKTVTTMDRTTFLTNDLELYNVDVTKPMTCYERYGLTLDESFICIDMSKNEDCFVSEFGPIFAYNTDRVVGLLSVRPKDCENKIAIFTNISYYYSWIIKTTGTADEHEDDPPVRFESEETTMTLISLPNF